MINDIFTESNHVVHRQTEKGLVCLDIDLMKDIEGERLIMHSATAEQIIQVLNLFDLPMCSAGNSYESYPFD